MRVLSIFVVLFYGLTFSPSVEAQKPAHKLYGVSPEKISNYIEATKGQRRALFLHASWCSACRVLMSYMMKMEEARPGSIISVSLDKDMEIYGRFVNRYKEIPFKLIVNNSSTVDLFDNIEKYGVLGWDELPNIILLDENNHVQNQHIGDAEIVADFLFDRIREPEKE